MSRLLRLVHIEWHEFTPQKVLCLIKKTRGLHADLLGLGHDEHIALAVRVKTALNVLSGPASNKGKLSTLMEFMETHTKHLNARKNATETAGEDKELLAQTLQAVAGIYGQRDEAS